LALSAAAAAAFGLLNGTLALRLRGEYLAIVTLALGQIIPRTVVNLDRWTSGARGIAALPPPSLLGHSLASPAERYYLVLGVTALAALGSLRLARSRLGRAWAALSMDEGAALSCGVPKSARVLVFVASATLAGTAGALFALSFSYMETGQSDLLTSAMVLAMVIIGGAGSTGGVLAGALLVAGVNQLALPRLGAWLGERGVSVGGIDLRSMSYLSFGLLLYGAVLLRGRRGKV
jgi:branched-chain amino acid transport system permease protein